MAESSGYGEWIGWIWRVMEDQLSILIPSSFNAAGLVTAEGDCSVVVGPDPRIFPSRRARRLSSVSTSVAFASVSESRPATKW